MSSIEINTNPRLLERKRLDLDAAKQMLNGAHGRRLWRSLEELANTPEFEEMLHREFPLQASEWSTGTNDASGVSRRRFLQLMSASLALGGLTACTRQPLERIVPYVKMPEEIVPGQPLFFATGMELDGIATGVLAESHMGRPTKIEGNPEHPASLGATDLFTQASILDLYDPDRNQTVQERGRIRSWNAFEDHIEAALVGLRPLQGEGLRILTGNLTSPSAAHLIRELLRELPLARWHQYNPVGRNSVLQAARLAFGAPASVRYDLTKADVVVALDADFLTTGPGAVRYSRDFMSRRRAFDGPGKMNRLYAVESATTTTATLADHRIPLSSAEVGHFAVALAAKLGVVGVDAAPGLSTQQFEDQVGLIARDLTPRRGRCVVIAGEHSSPELQVLAHGMNQELGNIGETVLIADSLEAEPVDQMASLGDLCSDMRSGSVDTLLVLGGNPVYDAPSDFEFLSALQQVPRRIHLGLHANETSEFCHWQLPGAHYLESWGDARAFDGTLTFTQPLIEPLYGGRSCVEVLSIFTEGGSRSGEDLLKEFWQGEWQGQDFDKKWRRVLHDGLVADSAFEPRSLPLQSEAITRAAASLASTSAPSADSLEVIFRPDPTVYDGRFNNNGWLQECPKPLTKVTWDNPALVSPYLAQRLGLKNGQIVKVEVDQRELEIPIWIHPGQPTNSITLTLGYGRTKTGRVGTGTGFNTYALRSSAGPWAASELRLTPTASTYDLASTQMHSNIELEGEQAEARHLIRTATLEEFEHHPDFAQHLTHGNDSLSLMPDYKYDGYAWGLSVDLSSCTGCNACVIACQSENNIPIVGREQVALGREMHWIRIDRYYQGDLDSPDVHHQPVMCMHCEQAPCEVVCPVAATVHSDEGLNDMVYNRCVGTRYCSNNCPYKVRRFNFLKWNDTETPVLDLLRNPDVTVRSRGVMEKCSYCVQRINHARIESKKEDRKIRDGEVQTACHQVCPTGAIVFGDLNDPESEVTRRKALPLDYGILSELGTRPRTTYLAKIQNPFPSKDEAA